MERIDETVSRLALDNDIAETEVVKSASSNTEPRRLKQDEAEHIIREAERQRERWGRDTWAATDETGPAPSLESLVRKEIQARDVPADQASRLLAAAAQRQDQADARRRDDALNKLADVVGARFVAATLENYKATTPEQKKVAAAVRGYAEHIRDTAGNGDGLILFGSAGTGKTHLLVAVAKLAIEAGLSVGWSNGQDLFSRFRAAIDGGESEARILKDAVAPDVMILDDLLPPGGALTDYQASTVYRIVDTRYRNCKATCVTMNVADGGEAEQGMGAQVVDRLRHGALTLFCNWPSYRKGATA